MIPVIPAPTRIETIDGAPFVLDAGTRVIASEALRPIARWFTTELAHFTDVAPGEGLAAGGVIQLELVTEDAELAALPATGGVRADGGDADGERYRLAIQSAGIRVQAFTAEGIFRGVTSLLQLAATTSVHEGTITLPSLTIVDTPRFAWRGLSLDVVRCFFPPEVVKRVIDVLALYKASVLHLHLTDAEGWRLEIDRWPRLTEVGGQTAAFGRPGGFYTKDEYRDLVAYAAARFITIVPEVDMPGHTAAIYQAYPELAGDGVHAETTNQDRASHFQVMHPDHPRIFDFVTDVLTEIAELTPGAYLHIGGDEALGMDEELYARFVQRVQPIVNELGKNVVGWQETARAGLAPSDLAQLWISPQIGDPGEFDLSQLPEDIDIDAIGLDPELMTAFAEMFTVAGRDLGLALQQGADIIVSQSTRAYLDTKYAEPSSDPAQEADWKRLGMPFYPRSTVAEFFTWDPATIQPELSEERVAGVEAGIWCETITNASDLFFLLLPRLPGLLEKGWSPRIAEDAAWAGYGPRLAVQARLWEQLDWPYYRSSVVWPD